MTGKDGWKYAFELPKFAEDGHEIIYTVGEALVQRDRENQTNA